jgi:hypothetical protein
MSAREQRSLHLASDPHHHQEAGILAYAKACMPTRPLWMVRIMGFRGVAMGFHGLEEVLGPNALILPTKRKL